VLGTLNSFLIRYQWSMIVTVLTHRYIIKLLALATLGEAKPKMAKISRLIRNLWPLTVTVLIHRYLINLLALATLGEASQIEMVLFLLLHPR
jgi:hypothetical protein